MKKAILTSAVAAALAVGSAHAAVIKLDGSNSIVTNTITVNGTDYRIIDAAGGTVTLTADNEYILDTVTFVENGVLAIEAGTIIRGELQSAINKNDVGALVITRTARIDAQGTAANPIIFTTAAIDNDQNGEADGEGGSPGVTINSFVDGSGEFDTYTKTGAQWTSGTDIFLDADPKNSPLAPTATFATDAVGVAPVSILDLDGSFDGIVDTYVENTPEYRSLWGGIIILGNAPTSIGRIDGTSIVATQTNNIGGLLDGVYEGFVEGLNILEVGERGIYGGHNPNDNSGVMRFVSIRHGGAQIGEGNEINGLTMGGVGRGTVIDFIEVYCNGDDGFEWFGGTVDNSYLISLYNNDDSFDIDEGYTGRGQFWFSLQLDDTVNGDHAGEHDGTQGLYDTLSLAEFGSVQNGGGLASAYITVYNATYIGGGTNGNTLTDSGNNRAFRIRDSFGGIYRNSIFSDFRTQAFRLDNDNLGRVNAGHVKFENNVFYGNAAAFGSVAAMYAFDGTSAYASTDPFDIAGTSNEIATDPFSRRRNGFAPLSIPAKFDRRGKFNSGVNSVGIDPRGFGTVVTSNLAGYDGRFFRAVDYKGAFLPSDTVDTIWTGADGSSTNPAWSVFGLRVLDLQ